MIFDPSISIIKENKENSKRESGKTQGCCKIFLFPTRPPKKEGKAGTPRTPAKGGSPLQSCQAHPIPDLATALRKNQGQLKSLYL